MALQGLLETSTVSWGDLFGNGRRYVVPRFQRDYSWTEDEWTDLWADIDALSESAPVHYMGAVVLRNEADGSKGIIDGQQRLATLAVIALASIKILREWVAQGVDSEENAQRADLLRDHLVGSKDPASLTFVSRMRLNDTDDSFFQAYLVQLQSPHSPGRLKGSERRLWLAFEFFRRKIDARFGKDRSGEALARFLNDLVSKGLVFIRIVVPDELSAYTVFETLNARGLELSSADLLKNYLFSRVAISAADLERARSHWARILARVPMERLARFLFHYVSSLGVANVTEHRLFATMRDRVTTPEQVFDILRNLESAADWYAALADPDDVLWAAIPEARGLVRDLNTFDVEQYKILMLAARDLVENQTIDLTRLLQMCVVVSLRAQIIVQRNTADVLRAYQAAAKVIADGGKRITAVFGALSSLYPSDEEFRNAFADKSIGTTGRRKKVVKYILGKLAQGQGAPIDTATLSIEHILPENPGNTWPSFTSEDRERFVYRLGNLALLEPALNRQAASIGFAEKLSLYSTSAVEATRSLTFDEWSPESVRARQQSLADAAISVWRFEP